MTGDGDSLDEIDVPLTVPPETAASVAEDLETEGKVEFEVREEAAPNLAKQIRWQLESDLPITEFVEEYDSE